jgi:hypothetical protein
MSAHRLLLVVVVAVIGAGACGGGGAPKHRPAKPTPTPSPAQTAEGPVTTWTHATVLRRIAGRRIAVAGKSVRIDPATVTCGGIGAPVRRNGHREWARFRCLQPTFPPGSVVGPDAIFTVQPGGPRGFTVADARFTRY